jgi:hypothetical protein
VNATNNLIASPATGIQIQSTRLPAPTTGNSPPQYTAYFLDNNKQLYYVLPVPSGGTPPFQVAGYNLPSTLVYTVAKPTNPVQPTANAVAIVYYAFVNVGTSGGKRSMVVTGLTSATPFQQFSG